MEPGVGGIGSEVPGTAPPAGGAGRVCDGPVSFRSCSGPLGFKPLGKRGGSSTICQDASKTDNSFPPVIFFLDHHRDGLCLVGSRPSWNGIYRALFIFPVWPLQSVFWTLEGSTRLSQASSSLKDGRRDPGRRGRTLREMSVPAPFPCPSPCAVADAVVLSLEPQRLVGVPGGAQHVWCVS